MDEAGIRRGVVHSIAYQFGNPFRPAVANEYARVKAENDWTAEQAGLRRGLNLHFGNSDVELDKPGPVAQMQRVFAGANRQGMAIVVHIRANIDHGRPWGAKQARVFPEQVLPGAQEVDEVARDSGIGRRENVFESVTTTPAFGTGKREARNRAFMNLFRTTWRSASAREGAIFPGVALRHWPLRNTARDASTNTPGLFVMLLVIADTSPIRYLVQIGHIDLLHNLFEAVSIPAEVAREPGDPRLPWRSRRGSNRRQHG